MTPVADTVKQELIPLLFIDILGTTAKVVLDDVTGSVDVSMLAILETARCTDRVLGVLAEKRLAGDSEPNVWEAICIANAQNEVALVVRGQDKCLLSVLDSDTLGKRVCELRETLSEVLDNTA